MRGGTIGSGHPPICGPVHAWPFPSSGSRMTCLEEVRLGDECLGAGSD